MKNSPGTQHPILLLLAVLMALALRTSAQLRFRQDSVCPPSSVPASQLLQGVRSQQSCAVECALRSDCAVYGFISSAGECRMGNTVDLLTSWVTPAATDTAPATSCVSQLNPRLPGVLSFRSSLLTYLDFRNSQLNLVGPARFSVSGNSPGVTFDSSGAVFPPITGGTPNYIELNTATPAWGAEAFGDLLGRGRSFSVFAKVQRLAGVTQPYYTMTDCSSHSKFQGGFGRSSGRDLIAQGLINSEELKFYSSNDGIIETSGQTIAVSAGAVFDGSKFTTAYYNGRFTETNSYSATGLPSFNGKPECIRLGFSLNSPECLVGRYVCFAIVKKMLNSTEFAELDAVCA